MIIVGFWQNMLLAFDSLHLPHIKITDIIEIIIICVLIYQFIKSLKNTRTFILLKAIAILLGLYIVAELCSFNAIKIIFQSLAIIALFATIVIFQPELRKTLEKLGTIGLNNFSIEDIKNIILKRKQKNNIKYSDKTISELTKAVFAMGEVKTGALIVMEGNVPLNDYISTGISLNADISSALLINIFEKNTPLHDGAIITIGDKVIAGTCYLPLSDNPKISKHLGTRHRAAIGITEVVDCFVIVVSEETGRVSFVQNGNITVCKKPEILEEKLKELQIKENTVSLKPRWNHNLSLKISSALIGAISWLLIINAADPVTTRVFYDVPVQVINQETISNIGKTFNIVSDDTIDVVVKDSRSIIDAMKMEDITITADMSKLSYVYSVPLSASTKQGSEISFLNENTLTVEMDEIISKEFPLIFNKVGTPSTGIYVSKITSNLDGIIITGAKSLIDTVDRIEFAVDITGAKENFTQVVTPVVYDKNGTLIDPSLYKLNKNEVRVSAELFNTKLIPVYITMAEQEVGVQYELNISGYSPRSIYVAGSDESLKKINDLKIEIKSEMNLQDATNDTFIKEININDYLPEGIYCASQSNKINVEIKYKPFITKTISFFNYDLTVNNKSEDYNLYFKNNKYSIDITGKESIINNLTIKDFKPYIDIQGLEAGLYNIKIMFSPVEGVKLKSDISVDIELVVDQKKD